MLSQRGAELYGHGLAFPFVLFLSPVAFLILFPLLFWLFLRWLPFRPARAVISGALAWSALSVALALAPHNLSNAELNNAARVFGLSFAAYMAVVGAVAGLLVSVFARSHVARTSNAG